MLNLSNIAIIGSGPTCIYLLKNILDHKTMFAGKIKGITIFEKEKKAGMGMPYHPKNTDIYNLANISSEEIPRLIETFGDWLRKQNNVFLNELNILKQPIDDKEIYSRVALGHYFKSQFYKLIGLLEENGVKITLRTNSEIVDIQDISEEKVALKDGEGKWFEFDTVVIASGHSWTEPDKIKSGYFASPWPIHKLIPSRETFYNFPVGILGASLSAIDVVATLSQHHGAFFKVGNDLRYRKKIEASGFKIVLHSAEGWLPHLQYEQQKPIREIYRHFKRKDLLNLIEKNGFLRLENYFNILCRPALIKAFSKDGQMDVVEKLSNELFRFKEFVEYMSHKHDYINSFNGMKQEMIDAKDSVNKDNPINWMETFDDLMYSINYHAEQLPAEDHIYFNDEIKPFLMSVIAALPLQSAKMLLALYEADTIELKSGFVSIEEEAFHTDITRIKISEENEDDQYLDYKIFIDCGGQPKLSIEEFPFESLKESGMVRAAKAKFNVNTNDLKIKSEKDNVVFEDENAYLKLPGIDVDSCYRIINKEGKPNDTLYDINFTHTMGIRPYSYGLQACNSTSLILVECWMDKMKNETKTEIGIENITKVYKKNNDL